MATSNISVENWFETTLSSSINASDTTISLNAVPTGVEGYLVIEPDTPSAREVIYFTSKTASAVVCPSAAAGRGVDGTTATSHASGATVRMTIVSAYWEALQDGSGLNIGALGGTPFATGWVSSVLPAVSSVTYNGNRSYDITFASTVASYLTPGMRLRTTRTVTAPTQCTSLNGTTQYYNKTSPSAMTFTDDFVVSAWVKLTSYAAGTIASRYNGTSGWTFQVSASGVVELYGLNAGAGNLSKVSSYQSLPLNKWVHVTAQLDMSSFTATTTTSYIMFDGKDIPAYVTRTGTNPTALIQAGNLEIGSYNGGTNLWTGKIAQVAIFNAKVTQATILGYISQGLAGSETSLISAYSFNNSINDLSANANNLTAQGSAVATNADSPFGQDSNGVTAGTTDYALVQKVATTVATVQVPEGCTIPTSGGVSAVALSSVQAPYGFTLDKGRWEVVNLNKTQVTTGAVASSATVTNFTSVNLTVPVGAGELDFNAFGQATHAGATNLIQYVGLSTANNSFSDLELVTRSSSVSTSVTEVDGLYAKSKRVSNSSQTVYYLNSQASSNNTTMYVSGINGVVVIRFTPAGI